MRALSRKESRDVDRRAVAELGIPSICLMENAGAGAAEIAREMLGVARGSVLCVCGSGGNGGDAMVVARHLAIAGIGVEIAHVGPPPSGDAATQFAICAAMKLPRRELRGETDVAALFARPRPALLVDGLYGTGLARPLDALAASVVRAMNDCGAPILALDVPSGFDCDAGEPLGACVKASVTATFVARKIGFERASSREWTGEVRVVSIGAPT